MTYFDRDFVRFLKDLAANNNRDWFISQKKRYEQSVKMPFQKFVEDMIASIRKDDPSVNIEARDAIFRINRDIRFSRDKSPYKTYVSAIISAGGKKDKTSPGVYIECTPEHVRIYGGVYMADKEQLYGIRTYIAGHLKEFKKAINDRAFKQMYGEIRGEKNKVIPKELKEAGAEQPLIYNKQFYYFGELKTEVLLRDDLVKTLMKYYMASKPVKDFLNMALLS